ncbi:MAG: hypothetical protein ACLU38_03970 [Dysosmobacter sp.]
MGEKLYEKASAKFSIQSTVDTQLHIYEEIIRRHNRPKRDRDGVVICGAYGRGNAGDDAILEAILQEMRSIDPDMPITVLTKDPKATRLTYRVRTAGRMDVGTWKRPCATPGLYINGRRQPHFRTSPPVGPCGSISITFRLLTKPAARCRCTAAASVLFSGNSTGS